MPLVQKVITVLTMIAMLEAQTFAGAQLSINETVNIFSSIETQFAQTHTSDDLVQLATESFTENDISWFRQQPGFQDLRKNLQISIKGQELRIAVRTAPKTFTLAAIIRLLDRDSLLYSINGSKWQARPFSIAKENFEALRRLLESNPIKTTASRSETIFSLLVPNAHAGAMVVALTALGALVAISAATIGICKAVTKANPYFDKTAENACFYLPLFPLVKGMDILKRLIGKREMPRITEISCRKKRTGDGEDYLKLAFQSGSVTCYTTREGFREVQVSLDPSGGQPALFRSYTADKNWNVTSPANQAVEKGTDKVAKNALSQLQLLLDLCKNPQRLAKLQAEIRNSRGGGVPVGNVSPSESGPVSPAK